MANSISISAALENVNMILDDIFLESIIPACCSEGCMVEPDGKCEHGFESAFIVFMKEQV